MIEDEATQHLETQRPRTEESEGIEVGGTADVRTWQAGTSQAKSTAESIGRVCPEWDSTRTRLPVPPSGPVHEDGKVVVLHDADTANEVDSRFIDLIPANLKSQSQSEGVGMQLANGLCRFRKMVQGYLPA